jgi:hypothetical protein
MTTVATHAVTRLLIITALTIQERSCAPNAAAYCVSYSARLLSSSKVGVGVGLILGNLIAPAQKRMWAQANVEALLLKR